MRKGLSILVPSTEKEGSGHLPYLGIKLPIREFRYRGKRPVGLSGESEDRFLAWLRLRTALNGSSAGLEDKRLALQKLLPAIKKYRDAHRAAINQDPGKAGNVRAQPKRFGEFRGTVTIGPNFALVPLEEDDPHALLQNAVIQDTATKTPQQAYEFWTQKILGLTAVVEWRGRPALLCRWDKHITALEVAHYAAVVLGEGPLMCLRCQKVFTGRSDAQVCSDRCKWAWNKANQRRKAIKGKG